MIAEPLFNPGSLEEAVTALRRDLLSEDGPEISTMRNYRFAIVPYEPKDEYKLRAHIQRLTNELKGGGWHVLSIALHKLLLDRIRALGDDVVRSWIEREKRYHLKSDERALRDLQSRISPLIEGPDGIAADVARVINAFCEANPGRAERTVVFIGRAGALFPFFRTSALLRHIDGRTRNVPVVLLYPGTRHDLSSLSFMGEVPPDGDYRPRIYP